MNFEIILNSVGLTCQFTCNLPETAVNTIFITRNKNQEAIASLEKQKEHRDIWRSLGSNKNVNIESCIEDAIPPVQEINRERGAVSILVTGCFRLLGGIFSILEERG